MPYVMDSGRREGCRCYPVHFLRYKKQQSGRKCMQRRKTLLPTVVVQCKKKKIDEM